MTATFSHLTTRFFTSFLGRERGLSNNTIASYRDCMLLLIDYACKRFAVEVERLAMDMFTREFILDFLDHLEEERKNSAATRNQRLAALKTFFHFLARTEPELMHLNELVQAIRPKKTEHSPPPSLTIDEVDAIIATPDSATLLGARDKALLQTAYNTGARVQELADLDVADLRLDAPASVTLTGKGNKSRVVPLWPETTHVITHYLQVREAQGIHSERLFLNNRAEPMTRFGIGRRVEKHARDAAARCPSLQGRRVTPHVFRHTTALHLIEGDSDINIVKEWLGHADLRTASGYVEVSVERKRKALEKVPPPKSSAKPERPIWKKPRLLDFLASLSNKARYVAKGTASGAPVLQTNAPNAT